MLNTSTPSTTPMATDELPRPGRVALLALSDLVILLAFAFIGLSNHKEAVTPGSIARTAAPFVLAWFIVAPWLGAFGRSASAASTRTLPFVRRSAAAWLVAWALALLVRALVFRDGIAPPFAIIALVFNAVLLLSWRAALSALAWRH